MNTIKVYDDWDLVISTGTTYLKVSLSVLKSTCKIFDEFSEKKSLENYFLIESPFPENLEKLIKWLHDRKNISLIQNLRFSDCIEIYSLSKIIGVKEHTNLRNVLLSIQFGSYNYNPFANISQALCKELIDIHFLLRLLKNITFSGDQKFARICILFEWLGEKNVENEKEFLTSTNSQYFTETFEAILRENMIPSKENMKLIKEIYPLTVNAIGYA